VGTLPSDSAYQLHLLVLVFTNSHQMLGRPTEQRPVAQKLLEWINVGNFNVDAGLLLDQLSICFRSV